MRIDDRVIEMYALFKRHVLLLENHRKRQGSIVSNIEQSIENQKENKFEDVLSLFNYVFLFVDLAIRIQKIVHSIPRINHKAKEYRAFDNSLGDLKDVRNIFQHINNEVNSNRTDHMLGTISWHSNLKLYSVSFQDISRTRRSVSMPFEVTEEQRLKVDHYICYVLDKHCFDLDVIYHACVKLCKFIDEKITLTDENGKIDICNKYDVWAIRLKEIDGGVVIDTLNT